MRSVRVLAADSEDGVALMDLRTAHGTWRFLDPMGADLRRRVVNGMPLKPAVAPGRVLGAARRRSGPGARRHGSP
ncbi:hypothetical protein, partial [Streptomyces sp. NPDC056549]|uniref:hypothetical protein n=1 Tax=Streptomyces sp. NPDC056549 TaxID=3345864 RepID=UPI0036BA7CA2